MGRQLAVPESGMSWSFRSLCRPERSHMRRRRTDRMNARCAAGAHLYQPVLREQAKGAQCVIVITGKGKSGKGVLKRAFLNWLDLPEARALVSGYAPAHAKHGGGGAWYVFLRRR